MPIKIISKDKQAHGSFNNGEILENKPIGFPQDGGELKPYSNLFYWAHAWSDVESTIGEHPHKGFEIMSFVLKGSIEHYDSKLKGWKTLNEGDVQIIRAGNGITHAEKLHSGAHIFQIWFDPDIRITLAQEASYDDYSVEQFPVIEENGIEKTIFKGNNAPIQMKTENVTIEQWDIKQGTYNMNMSKNTVVSLYCLSGIGQIQDNSVQKHDFLIVNDEKTLKITTENALKLFAISSPVQVSHPTYAMSALTH